MHIYEAAARTPELLRALLPVWEASVRTTHLFLSEPEILRIRQYVPQAIGGVEHLLVAEAGPGAPVGFYSHLGFETYNRTDRDEEGGPYPLLYMKLKK